MVFSCSAPDEQGLHGLDDRITGYKANEIYSKTIKFEQRTRRM